ncbi:MAG TPA: hypothetical protein VGX03_29670 [Candidatus Binatia bacterium]|jgi:TolB protein|nr:hypothetical protein [Candidatus Binatia bacterium]
MNTKVLQGLFLSALFLPLVTLSTPNAIVRGETDSHPLGIISYLKGGDRWVKELPNGQAQRLAIDGHSTGSSPSPSGQWKAYPKDGELWVARSSGTDARALSPGTEVGTFAWSPVSDILAYIPRLGGLHMASADEWREREVVAAADDGELRGFFSLAWSPNGKWLVYVREEMTKGEQPPDNRYASLWRIRADGSDAAQLFDSASAPGALMVAGWSPDSQYILFRPDPLFSASLLADGISLMAISVSGGKPTKLVESMLAHEGFLAWSPDGKLLAVTEGFGRETWSHKRIAVVELTGGTLTYLTDDKTAALSPVWSPDGRRIAYIAAPDIGFLGGGEEAKAGVAKRRIWVMNRDGSAQRQLTHDATFRDEQPLWSADGGHLVFARLDQSGRASLWLMRDDGSELQQMDELSPAPEWFGYYGYIDWGGYFAWWPGAIHRPPPLTE